MNIQLYMYSFSIALNIHVCKYTAAFKPHEIMLNVKDDIAPGHIKNEWSSQDKSNSYKCICTCRS